MVRFSGRDGGGAGGAYRCGAPWCLESRIDSSRRVGRDTVVECVPSVQYTVRFEPVLDPLPQRNIGRTAPGAERRRRRARPRARADGGQSARRAAVPLVLVLGQPQGVRVCAVPRRALRAPTRRCDAAAAQGCVAPPLTADGRRRPVTPRVSKQAT